MNQQDVLKMVEEELGFVPNLLQTMSVSPGPVQVYVQGAGMMAEGHLTEAEQQVVYLATSVNNDCAYCTSAHSVLGEAAGVSREDVQALRAKSDPADARLAALARATRLVMDQRGHLDAEALAGLEADGVTRAELYDIVALMCLKMITNYISHIEQPVIDEPFTYQPELFTTPLPSVLETGR